jgi:hypothetical protein
MSIAPMNIASTRFFLWPVLFIFSATAIFWWAGTPIINASIAGLVLCGTALPIMAFLGPRRVCKDLPLFVAAVAAGLVLVGCVSTLAKASALQPEAMISVFLIIGFAGSIWHARQETAAGDQNRDEISAPPSTALRIAAFALALTLSSVLLVYSFRMGAGPYPAVFYGVDNAYLLSIVRSLVSSDLFPPNSLNFIGQMGPYHYAMLEAGAMLARITGLAPHTTFFLAGSGCLTLGTVALCWLIARTIIDGWLRLPIMALLYIGTFYQNSLKFTKKVGQALISLLSGNIDQQLPLSLNVAHVVTQAGTLLALWVVYLIFRHSFRRRPNAISVLIVLLVGASAGVKVQHFITYCLWLGAICFIAFLQEHPWRAGLKRASVLALHHAWPVLAGFLLGFATMRLEKYSDSGRQLVFALFANDYVNTNLIETFKHAAILFVPSLIALLLARGRHFQDKDKVVAAAAISILPLLLVSVTALGTPDGDDTDFGWFLITGPATIGIALSAGLLVAGVWRRLTLIGRGIVAFAFVIAIGTQTLRFPLMAVDTILHPDHGEEVMDNADLIPALSAIPTEGSVLVTNDLRNPAENYKRPDRQTQLSAIFGHQCFLAVPSYDRWLPDLAARKAAQELLRLPNWDPQIGESARQYGWTHFLVHKDASYPADIPLDKIYDSASYAVYRF